MADLWWMTTDIAGWLKITQHMEPTAGWALHNLCLAAWSEPGDETTPPCSLLDDDGRLMRAARVTPAAWRRIAPELRRLLPPIPECPGRLRASWLWDLYQKAAVAHSAAVVRGRKGGRPKGSRKRAAADAATTIGTPNSNQNSEQNPKANPKENSKGNFKFPSKVNLDETSSDLRGASPPALTGQGGEDPRDGTPLAVAEGPGAPPRNDSGAPDGAPAADRPSLVRLADSAAQIVAAELADAPPRPPAVSGPAQPVDAPAAEITDPDVLARREARRLQHRHVLGRLGHGPGLPQDIAAGDAPDVVAGQRPCLPGNHGAAPGPLGQPDDRLVEWALDQAIERAPLAEGR